MRERSNPALGFVDCKARIETPFSLSVRAMRSPLTSTSRVNSRVNFCMLRLSSAIGALAL